MLTLVEAIKILAPFCWTEARTHMVTPFYVGFRGAAWLAATDGHTAAIVRCDEAPAAKRADAPPLDAVLSTIDLDRASDMFKHDAFDAARTFPARMSASLVLGPDVPRLRLTAERGSGKRKITHVIVDGSPVPWGVKLPACGVGGIACEYLLRAIDFVGTGAVTVSHAGALDPFVFSAPVPAADRERFAIVMPMRV